MSAGGPRRPTGRSRRSCPRPTTSSPANCGVSSRRKRTGPSDPAAEEAYWDLFSYMSRKMSRLVPALRTFLDRRGFSDLCEHEATAFLTAALSQALAIIEDRDDE